MIKLFFNRRKRTDTQYDTGLHLTHTYTQYEYRMYIYFWSPFTKIIITFNPLFNAEDSSLLYFPVSKNSIFN